MRTFVDINNVSIEINPLLIDKSPFYLKRANEKDDSWKVSNMKYHLLGNRKIVYVDNHNFFRFYERVIYVSYWISNEERNIRLIESC